MLDYTVNLPRESTVNLPDSFFAISKQNACMTKSKADPNLIRHIEDYLDGHPNKSGKPMSVRALEILCDVGIGTIQSILKNKSKNPRKDVLEKIYVKIGRPDIYVEKYAMIPLYDAAGAAGAARWNDTENKIDDLAFSRMWLRTVSAAPQDKLAVIEVSGDSMEPNLYNGSHVMVDLTDVMPRDGKIYAIKNEGGLVIKRVTSAGSKITLHSDNAFYKPIELQNAKDIQIVGRVIWAGRKM